MTVWVLLQNAPYEGDALYGVYSREDEALKQRALLQATSTSHEARYWVIPVVLDTDPVFRSYWSDDALTS